MSLMQSLQNIGFSADQSGRLEQAHGPVLWPKSDEAAAQLWFSRWHQNKRLLVWESQEPGPDFFVNSISVQDALTDSLGPVLQIGFEDAPPEMHNLYSQEHLSRAVLFDNGSGYKLIGYEYA